MASVGTTRTISGVGVSALAPPPALVETAHAFRALFDADVVWLAVRESRARSAVIRYAEGARDRHGLGVRVTPGIGVGGTVLLSGRPWSGCTSAEEGLSPSERALLLAERIEAALVLPLLSGAGTTGLEALVYVGSRQSRIFQDGAIEQGLRIPDGSPKFFGTCHSPYGCLRFCSCAGWWRVGVDDPSPPARGHRLQL